MALALYEFLCGNSPCLRYVVRGLHRGVYVIRGLQVDIALPKMENYFFWTTLCHHGLAWDPTQPGKNARALGFTFLWLGVACKVNTPSVKTAFLC